ncbi:MAG: hypothetical protein JNG88_03150 [Phycisphaerales bacterium]|nr:hypothetical protein [Phycisphaerales bacterium]
MNHHNEFESYLNLLTRFLRLSARERASIRRELESHLAEAVEDAIERGVPREAAIQQALEEFGDAAELASRFRQIGRTRRWVMRSTAIAACALVMFAGFHLFAPDRQIGSLAAGDEAAQGSGGARGPQPAVSRDERRDQLVEEDERIEAALSKPVEQIELQDVPFEQFVEWLQAQTNANVVVQWRAMEETGAIPRDFPISLKLRNVSLSRALDLIFAASRDVELGYAIDDGVLVIGPMDSLDHRLSLVVYDVRDLLESITEPAQAGGAASADDAKSSNTVNWGSMGRGDRGSNATQNAVAQQQSSNAVNAGTRAQSELGALIVHTVRPDAWDGNGGRAAMRFINDALVVRAPKSVHRELSELLEGLRGVMHKRASR